MLPQTFHHGRWPNGTQTSTKFLQHDIMLRGFYIYTQTKNVCFLFPSICSSHDFSFFPQLPHTRQPILIFNLFLIPHFTSKCLPPPTPTRIGLVDHLWPRFPSCQIPLHTHPPLCHFTHSCHCTCVLWPHCASWGLLNSPPPKPANPTYTHAVTHTHTHILIMLINAGHTWTGHVHIKANDRDKCSVPQKHTLAFHAIHGSATVLYQATKASIYSGD